MIAQARTCGRVGKLAGGRPKDLLDIELLREAGLLAEATTKRTAGKRKTTRAKRKSPAGSTRSVATRARKPPKKK